MYVQFHINPATGEPHIFDHDVAESEALEILRNSTDRGPADDGAMQAVGQTRNGRYLKVIYVADPDCIFVITAYDLRPKEQGFSPPTTSAASTMKTHKKKDPNQYPRGWNRERVERVIRYYDTMTDAEGAAEIESLPPVSDVIWVAVPKKLVPRVRKLLDGYRKSA